MDTLEQLHRACKERAWQSWYRGCEWKLEEDEKQARASYGEALKSVDQALALVAEDPEVHYLRGVILGLTDCPEEAATAFEEARRAADRRIELHPDAADGYFWRGKVLAGHDRHQAALKDFDHAISLRSDYPEAHLSRGGSLQQLQDYDEALSAYDRAVMAHSANGFLGADEAASPRRAMFRYNQAVAYFNKAEILWQHLHRYPEALEAYARVIELKPPFVAQAREWRRQVWMNLMEVE